MQGLETPSVFVELIVLLAMSGLATMPEKKSSTVAAFACMGLVHFHPALYLT
jgi:hypothetical protein